MKFGGLAAIVLSITDIPYFEDIGVFTAISGACVNMAQVFADRMYASEDRPSAVMYDVIIAALTAVGLIISAQDKWLFPVLTGAGLIAGILLLAGLKNGSTIQKGFGIMRYTPAALMRGWLAPAMVAIWALVSMNAKTDIAAAFLGIAILEWCEPVYRRAQDESAACSVALSALSVIWLIFCLAVTLFEQNMPEWYSRAPFITVDFVEVVPVCCALAMAFGVDISFRRIAVSVILVICIVPLETELSMPTGMLVSFGLCVAALLLTLPDMADLRRIAKARRIQKRRRKTV